MAFTQIFSQTVKYASIAAGAKASLMLPANTDALTIDNSNGYGPFNQFSVANNSTVLIQILLNGNPTNAIEIPAGVQKTFTVERALEIDKNLFYDIIAENLDGSTATGNENIVATVSKVVL